MESGDQDIQALLACATLSRPTPVQSGYFVRGAVQTRDGRMLAGGNHEYGLTNAIHCEETLVARWLEEAPEDPIVKLLFASDEEPKTPPACCGNCRDLLLQYLSPNAEIIDAGKGKVVRSSFSCLLFEEFEQMAASLSGLQGRATEKALRAYARSYDLYAPRQAYGAAIIADGHIATGGFEGDVAYHATLPIRSALISLLNADGEERFDVREVLLAAPHGFRVPYKDRQHLMEFVARINAYRQANDPIPITIIQGDRRYRTDSHEWLPYPFDPAHLGMDQALADSIRKSI